MLGTRYVEWEDYPEKRQAAYEILTSQEFPPPPEFQLEQIPGTNPLLEGKSIDIAFSSPEAN